MTNATKKKISEAIKKSWKNKKVRNRHIKAAKKIWKRKGYHKKLTEKLNKIRGTLKYRRKQSKILKKCFKAPKITKAYRKKLSIAQKLAWKEGRRKPCSALTYSKVSQTELNLKKVCKEIGLKCKHQFLVKGTLFTGDFLFGKNLIVEVDGHYSHYTKKGLKRGKLRDKLIRKKGYRILHLNRKCLKKGYSYCISLIKKKI